MINTIALRIKEFFQPIIDGIVATFEKILGYGKNIISMLPWGKNKQEEALEAPKSVSTPLSQQEQENKLEQEYYENKSKTSIDVNCNNLPKGVVVNQNLQ